MRAALFDREPDLLNDVVADPQTLLIEKVVDTPQVERLGDRSRDVAIVSVPTRV
jgi:hypothetical protein